MTRPKGAEVFLIEDSSGNIGTQAPVLPPLQHLQPATRVLFGLGAVLQRSHTPLLRVAGFEDENEAPCEGGRSFVSPPGVKTRWLSPSSLRDKFESPSEQSPTNPRRE